METPTRHIIAVTDAGPDHDDFNVTVIYCPYDGDVRPCSLYFECEHTSYENTEAFEDEGLFAECAPGIPHENIGGYGICALHPGCGLKRADNLGEAAADVLPLPYRNGEWLVDYEFDEDALYLTVVSENE
jgi:hypothetical protein